MIKYAVEQYEGNSTAIVEIHPVEGGTMPQAKKLITKLRQSGVVASNAWEENHIDELEAELLDQVFTDVLGGKLVDRFIPRLYFADDDTGELLSPVLMWRGRVDKALYYNVGCYDRKHKFVKIEQISGYLRGDNSVIVWVDDIMESYTRVGSEIVEVMTKQLYK